MISKIKRFIRNQKLIFEKYRTQNQIYRMISLKSKLKKHQINSEGFNNRITSLERYRDFLIFFIDLQKKYY